MWRARCPARCGANLPKANWELVKPVLDAYLKPMRRFCIPAGLVLPALMTAAPVAAHPHIFVDTSLRVFVKDAEAVSVEVTWVYDDFFSLLIFEDMGLDGDGDGVLTEAELARLKGFDFEYWPEGFEGDLYAYSAGEKLALEHPQVTGIAVENGRIVSRHIRPLPQGTPAQALEILQYDPTYYVAYSLTSDVSVEGGCALRVTAHDPKAAREATGGEFATMPDTLADAMKVGVHFADRISLTCDNGF